MMVISRAQMIQLRQRLMPSMAARIHNFVYGHFSSRLLSEATDLSVLVSAGIRRASQLGFHQEMDICLYVLLSVMLGPDFEKATWAQAILTDQQHDSNDGRALNLYMAALGMAIKADFG